MPHLEVIRERQKAAVLLRGARQELLARLAEPDSASGLSRKLGVPRQRINYHLRALEREGLVELVEERRRGNCTERVVRATARAFVISPEALGALQLTPDAATDRFSAAYQMTAAARALRDVAALQARAARESKRVPTLTIDAEVRFAAAADRAAFAEDLTAAVAAIVAKYHDERAPAGRRFRLVTLVHPLTREAAAATPEQQP
jgi:DNA-binding transcriptional ArsR family regulator